MGELAGYKGEFIKDYFCNHRLRNSDFFIDMAQGHVQETSSRAPDWRLNLVDTGLKTQTGDLKHILIDCGVHAGDIGTISDAVDHMAEVTNKNLALVIMTHRHADHISGFAKCKDVFSGFTVEQVLGDYRGRPWDARADVWIVLARRRARRAAV